MVYEKFIWLCRVRTNLVNTGGNLDFGVDREFVKKTNEKVRFDRKQCQKLVKGLDLYTEKPVIFKKVLLPIM